MRILYCSDTSPSTTTFIKQDIDCVSKLHTVHYICFESIKENKNDPYTQELIKFPSSSVKSKIIWRLEKLSLCFRWQNKSFSDKLTKAIESFKPDIIHCQFAYEASKLIFNFKNTKKIPIVINFRGYDASGKLKNRYYANWLKQTLNKEYIYSIFVCKSLKNNLLKKEIKFKNTPYILYTGVDLAKFKPKKTSDPLHQGKNIFLQVGSFHPKKGQEYVIKSFHKIHDKIPNHILLFIGEGPTKKYCQTLVTNLQLESKVIFLGTKNTNEIIEYLNQTQAFIHPSITSKNGDQEGIPNSVIEAMAMKIPIVSTYHSGIPEAIEPKINGLLIEEINIDQLSTLMLNISNWEKKDENREKVERKFSLDIHLKNLLSFYAQFQK